MKERPILFSAPMVRAILAGTKTQTRRVLKGANHVSAGGAPLKFTGSDIREVQCPYGWIGDRLWVREAWRTVAEMDDLPPHDLNTAHRIWFEANSPHQPGAGKLRPSMFMPRWASRITLEVTGVRVERLQDISEADAIAEGIERVTVKAGATVYPLGNRYSHDATEAYSNLWEQINGPGSWEANPWVWVVEFKRLKGGEA